MATNNPKTARDHISVTGFGGIADHAGLALDAATDVRNFRILSDGSLEKRCGYLKRFSFSQPLRGLWEGVVGGESYLFAVAGNQIFVRLPGTSNIRTIYTMTTSEGAVSFFLYRDQLWLLDGTTLLLFRHAVQKFAIAQGYVPLYGRNWHPTSLGEVNEPLNLARNEIRIHYYNTNGSTTFNLPFTTQALRRVAVNGINITSYTFKAGTSYFSIPTAYASLGSVEVYATLDPVFSGRETVLGSMRSKVFRTPHHETAMLYGSQKAGYLLYRTSPVSDEMLEECSISAADADHFYVAKDTAFAVGSAAHPVTDLCQLEDQMLVFSDESMWAIRYPEDHSNDAEIYPLRAGLGCTTPGGVVLGGKYPIVSTSAGVARLKFSASDPDFCETEILSSNIRNSLTQDYLQYAILFWDEFRQELWVRNILDPSGSVYIYAPERDVWFRFDNIHATRFFMLDGAIGFTNETAIFSFAETQKTDSGSVITAVYASHFLDLSRMSAPRRSIRLSVVTQDDGNTLTTQIQTERASKAIQLRASTTTSGIPIRFDRRLAMGRFHILRYVISSGGQSRCRIFSYSIAANP